MRADLLVRGAKRLLTCSPDHGSGRLGVIENAALLASEGRVVWVGAERDLPAHSAEQTVDAGGGVVLPGLVDPHTHLVFAGDRSQEFIARTEGMPYSSGGISTTVAATRRASDEDLAALALRRLDRFASFGVTTVEAKSGYGSDASSETRLVKLASDLEHPVVRVIPTYLGAHVIPEGSDEATAVEEVLRALPGVAAKARFADAWCEEGAFGLESCERVLSAAREHGLGLKLHTEQLSRSGGAQLAARLGCVSADHLEHATEDDARSLSDAGVIAVLMPGASIMTGQPLAPARMLLEAGVRVALSTDLNPGSSYSENLPLQVSLAVTMMSMSLEEAILGVTAIAADACGLPEAGRLLPGSSADMVVLDAPHEAELAYHYGSSAIAQVVSSRTTGTG